ncbi:MAG: hypothetical protein ACK416_06140 [Zestosphaera sp.]
MSQVLSVIALQTIPVTVTPTPPPGLGEAITRMLSWLYWVAWVAVVGAGLFGGFKIATGDYESGKKYLGGAIAGAAILAFLWVLIGGILGS